MLEVSVGNYFPCVLHCCVDCASSVFVSICRRRGGTAIAVGSIPDPQLGRGYLTPPCLAPRASAHPPGCLTGRRPGSSKTWWSLAQGICELSKQWLDFIQSRFGSSEGSSSGGCYVHAVQSGTLVYGPIKLLWLALPFGIHQEASPLGKRRLKWDFL